MTQNLSQVVRQTHVGTMSIAQQQQPCNRYPSVSSINTQKIIDLKRKCPALEDFIRLYNPSIQREVCRDAAQCYFGNSPTLSMLNLAYGKGAAQTWLVPQIANLVLFSGVDGVPDTEMYMDIVAIIETERPYLKVEELMLFFWRFKSGHYRHFYKSFEPHIIIDSLNDFVAERNSAYRRKDEHDRKLREEEERLLHPPVTWEHYLELKSHTITE